MEKFKNVIANIRAKAREKKEVATTVLDNRGLNHTGEVVGWSLASLILVALAVVAINKFFPQLFTDIFAKFSEMLNSWTITTTP